MATTRKALRRMIGQGLGECEVLVATSNGTTTTFLDNERLTGPTNAYKGHDLYFTSGANLGKTRRIVSSTQATGRAEWQTPLTATLAGDEAELWNTRGIGIEPVPVNDAINWSIAISGDQALVAVEAVATLPFDRDDPRVTIPAAITEGITGVLWEDENGILRKVERAMSRNDHGWYYDRASNRLIIGGPYRDALDTYDITVRGVRLPDALTADTDTTAMNVEWLTAEATRRVLQVIRMKNPDAERWLGPATNESAYKRPLATGRGIPDLVRFR